MSVAGASYAVLVGVPRSQCWPFSPSAASATPQMLSCACEAASERTNARTLRRVLSLRDGRQRKCFNIGRILAVSSGRQHCAAQ